MDTIPDLISHVARTYGRRPALGIRRGLRTEVWSYQDVERGMQRAAARLRVHGVEPGDRIMVLAPNSPELVLSMLGAWAAGAILVPIDLRTPPEVMDRIRERTGPRLLISDLPGALTGLATVTTGELAGEWPPPPAPLSGAERGRSETGGSGAGLDRVGMPDKGGLGSGLDRVGSWKPAPTEPGVGAGFQQPVAASPDPNLPPSPQQPVAAGPDPNLPPALPPLRAGEAVGSKGPHGRMAGRGGEVTFGGGEVHLAEIVFTSGTTGAPKGVMLTHGNILANVRSAQEALPIAVGERLLSLLPLSHMMEQTAGLLAALAAGATVFYATSRRSSSILAAFQRHQIGLLVCVPEVLALLMAGIEREVERSGRRRAWDVLNAAATRLPMAARPWLFPAVHRRLGGRFRMALCGGAALSETVQAAWERLGVRVIQGYGATECAPIIASNRHDARVPGTVGWPLPSVEVRLAADGEILVRGPNVTPGYWQDAAATEASFEDGWYRTGDLGEWVGRGGEVARGVRSVLRLRGRKKEMIVLSDGRNVFPEDVEPALRADSAVRDCAVVGRARASGGAEVHAVVIPADGSDGSRGAGREASIEAAVRRANAKLGPHQQIGGWTVWEGSDFPRTPSLKVKRAEVLAALAEHRATTDAAPAAVAAAGDTLEARVSALLARATGCPAERVRPEADLHLDLGLDSLGRVELAVLLEEELGRSLSDEQVAELRTVGDLLTALEQPASATPPAPLPGWPRSRPVRALRALFQDAVLFPLLRRACRPLSVQGQEHLERLRGPALLIANHASHLDSVTVLAALPEARRRRTAVAAAADYFFADARRSVVASLVLGAFPFHRTGPVAASLAHCGDLADTGFSLLVFPEGTRSLDGGIAPFKPGIGLLARELGLPVVPVHLDGPFAVLPKGRTLPRPGPVRVTIGAPVRVDPTCTNAEAAARLEAALRALAPAARSRVEAAREPVSRV